MIAPSLIDVDRENKKHLSFGVRAHCCHGAALARLEALVAFRSLSCRYPHLGPDGQPPVYRDNFNLRGLKSLAVNLSGR